MGLLGSGVLLWSLAHLMKRVAPGWRSRLGSAGRPLVAVSIVLSVVLMVLGYQQAEGPLWWGRQSALVGINNLLVLIGFYMIAGSIIGARISRFIRHPQLTAIKLWAVAHVLVNGDLASLMLFGGLLKYGIELAAREECAVLFVVDVSHICRERVEDDGEVDVPAPRRRDGLGVLRTHDD